MKNDTLNFPMGWIRGQYTTVPIDFSRTPHTYDQVMEWLEHHPSSGRFSYELTSVVFDHKEDAVMFLLRWA